MNIKGGHSVGSFLRSSPGQPPPAFEMELLNAFTEQFRGFLRIGEVGRLPPRPRTALPTEPVFSFRKETSLNGMRVLHIQQQASRGESVLFPFALYTRKFTVSASCTGP